MTRIHSRTGNRSAFTMIELMMVILIIALLVSLVTAAVMKVMGKIPETQTRVEIGELDQALASFMADYNLPNPPPSTLYLREDGLYNLANAADQATVNFLQQWFGRSFNVAGVYNWNGNLNAAGLPNIDAPYILQGQQCLVFYLGGIPTPWVAGASGNVVSGMMGFSPNVAVSTVNPFGPASPAVAGTNRKGPYFTFTQARLYLPPGLSFPVLIDAWKRKTGFYPTVGTPYAFFSSSGKMNGYSITDCALIDAAGPYYETTAAGANFTNNNRYQIISAGENGVFGGGAWIPASGATGNGFDDQANFSSGLLGTGQR